MINYLKTNSLKKIFRKNHKLFIGLAAGCIALFITGGIVFGINIKESDLQLGTADGRPVGSIPNQRALVHDVGDVLILNYAGDFEGGVRVGSRLYIAGSDLTLGTGDGRSVGNKSDQRALVHDIGDTLVLNYAGDFEGGIRVDSNISAHSYSCSSDLRYKTNIVPINKALEKILALQGVNYNWNTTKFKDKNFDSKTQLGFVAQEVEKIVPELVQTDADGYKTMSYDRVTAILVEAMKEIKAKNDKEIIDLKAQNESILKENFELKTRLSKLEDLSKRVALLEVKRGTSNNSAEKASGLLATAIKTWNWIWATLDN